MKDVFSYAICPECKTVVTDVLGSTENLCCCGKPLKKLTANTVEASAEKHIPVVEVMDGELAVRVGSIEHPMTKEHYIMWVSQVADNRETKVIMFPEQDTTVRFPYIRNCKIYAYCNLHGLWMTEFKG